jgi:putative hydrolase of the HAD superfamily
MTSATGSSRHQAAAGSHNPGAWPRPRGLLLDAMGTLIGLRSSVGCTYAEVAAGHGLQLEADAIDRAFPSVYRQAPPLAFADLQGESLEAAERGWWADRIDEVLQRVGATAAPEALHRDLFDRFADPSLWHVHHDVADHLNRWRGEGLRLAVVSNFDGRLHGLLQGLGLDRWIEMVVVSSSAGAAKPSPLPFWQALAGLDLQPAQAWHVGDSPEDAAGARAAGVRCLIVRRP